ncbi:MAG: ABC transporter ATP-binding protein [Pontibacterium sp.]
MSTPYEKYAIYADSVSKQFNTQAGTLTLFTHLNLAIDHGDTVAIVGPSGAGKSTLLSLLSGLDTPSNGHVYINGNSTDSLSEQARAKLRAEDIGFIFQTFHLLPELSAFDNLMLPLEIANTANPEALATEWLTKVGLGDRMHHLPNQLSGGEQQRVAIARAFVCSPNILFADEPTGNLDETTGNEIADQLFALNKDQNTTLVLITHDPALAAKCHKQYRLKQGTLEAL